MPAYVIVNVEIKNPEHYAEYIEMAPASIARHGGKYLVRGGKADLLEGDWEPKRVVVLEFPTYEAAHAWWASDDYAGPKALRQRVAITDLVIVDGV